ncbi:hypothetical protein [Brevibacillus laterosporus]|uniref:hypothetical protein n=1 Tax=Brevibacillus laterosporus TaxID=1465 RepID=UPI00264BF018|nr:hypothetical protein [Brevibacillus laterosporus]MDN9008955.1 hypothetical protein [Brevibacillus laterosporus]MDO0941062.1 hypothetical protein [Brevibacillus laterosporus]
MDNRKQLELNTEGGPFVFSAMFDLQASGGQNDCRVIPDAVLLEGLYPKRAKEKQELLNQWKEMQQRLDQLEKERIAWQEQIKEYQQVMATMESKMAAMINRWEMLQHNSEKWKQQVEKVVLQWNKEREQIYQIVLAIKKEWESNRA